jgi:hypothetical protein
MKRCMDVWTTKAKTVAKRTQRGTAATKKKDKNVHIRVGATLVALQGEAEASPTQFSA